VKTDGTGSTSYTWDYENRMTSVILPGSGGTVSFRYDPFGRRIISRPPAAPASSPTTMTTFVEETNAGAQRWLVTPKGQRLTSRLDAALLDNKLLPSRRYGLDHVAQQHLGSTGEYLWLRTVSATLWPPSAILSTASDTRDANSTQKLASITTGPDTMTCNPAGSFREDPYRWTAGINFYRYVRNRPTYFRDPSGKLNIASGFPPNCLKDLLDGIKILQDRIRTLPGCNCFFTSHGLHAPLDLLLASPLFTVNYDPQGNAEKNEKRRLAYVLPAILSNLPNARGCASGPAHIAQDLAHEFAHISLGHASEYYNNHPLPRTRTTLLRDKRKLPVVSGFKRRRLSSSRLRERSKGS